MLSCLVKGILSCLLEMLLLRIIRTIKMVINGLEWQWPLIVLKMPQAKVNGN